MYPLLVVALMSALIAALMGAETVMREATRQDARRVIEARVDRLGKGLREQFQETGQLPGSLNDLRNAAGFEHLRSDVSGQITFAVSTSISEGQWSFERAVVFANDRSRGATDAQFLATNQCGADPAQVAGSWCGPANASWSSLETRAAISERLYAQRKRMIRTLQKFAQQYALTNGFPSVDGSGARIPPNTTIALSELAGVASGAGNCRGVHVYRDVPIDCEDLFDLWGGQVAYQFFSDQSIGLTVLTPVRNSAGVEIVLGVELTAS